MAVHNSQVWKKFTEPGEPGELLRPHYENMAAQLEMQGRMVGTGMVSDPQCPTQETGCELCQGVLRMETFVWHQEDYNASRSAICRFAFVQDSSLL